MYCRKPMVAAVCVLAFLAGCFMGGAVVYAHGGGLYPLLVSKADVTLLEECRTRSDEAAEWARKTHDLKDDLMELVSVLDVDDMKDAASLTDLRDRLDGNGFPDVFYYDCGDSTRSYIYGLEMNVRKTIDNHDVYIEWRNRGIAVLKGMRDRSRAELIAMSTTCLRGWLHG